MNRFSGLFAKSLFIVAFAAAQAHAAEPAQPAKPDPAKGATLFANGDSTRGIPACASCHGDGGNSTIAQNPKLASQHEAYLVKQLNDFKGPNRNNAVMTDYAKKLSDDEIRNVAAYLSAQPLKPGAAKNNDTVELGKKIYRAGIPEKGVPACAACHGPGGAGIPAQFPRIGAQHQEYMMVQLDNF